MLVALSKEPARVKDIAGSTSEKRERARRDNRMLWCKVKSRMIMVAGVKADKPPECKDAETPRIARIAHYNRLIVSRPYVDERLIDVGRGMGEV